MYWGYFTSQAEKVACIAAMGVAAALIGPACFLASAPSAEVTYLPCVMAVLSVLAGATITKCPKYAACLYSSYILSNPPDVKVTAWTRTGTREWTNISPDPNNNPQWVNADLWSPQVSVMDDWNPPPRVEPAATSFSVVSGQSVTITATDCNGKVTSNTFKAPDLSDAEIATMRKDNPETAKPVSPPQGNQPPAGPVDYTYQGYWTDKYKQDSQTKSYTCDPAYLEITSWSLLFNPDGTITLHNCRAKDAITNCKVDFKPGKSEGTYVGIGDFAGYMLIFPSIDMNQVVFSFQSAMKDGSPSYCEENFSKIGP